MKASVIMPVYNAEQTVLNALESLRAQTYPSIEIIVINDGSIDGTRLLLRQQPGIKLLDHSHRGIAESLNDGLAAANGKYIARMDADDLCHPERLAQQVDYLERHPEIGVVSCRVTYGGDRETQAGYAAYVDWINTLTEPDEIALNRFIESPLAHPSVMFRRDLFEQYGAYRDGLFPEDYELWLRWMACGIQFGKVDEELVTWNDPPDRLSRVDQRYSTDAFYEIKAEYLFLWLEQNNPHHPDVMVWGAGRVTRQRVAMLQQLGLNVTHYIDLKPRQLNCETPVLLPDAIPGPENTFVLSMVGKRGARELIRDELNRKGYQEGQNCLFAA